MIKQKITDNLILAVKKAGINEPVTIDVETPSNNRFGDFSTAIALKLGKMLKKNPMDIAESISQSIQKDELIEKIEVIKPGFINFQIAITFLIQQTIKAAVNQIEYPTFHLGKNKKIMVEYAHPNTHKLFHIGHLRNITTGESIIRILKTVGNKMIKVNYQGDVGLHIAKCLYAIQNSTRQRADKIQNLKSLKEKIKFIGKAYTEGTKAYEEDENAKKEIIDINRMIYDHNPKIMPIWKETRQWSLDYFNEMYKRVDSSFDRFYFESELPKRGIEIAQEALEKGVLEKSQGAIVFNGKKYGLDTRVFINSLGFPTYEGKELALSEIQFSEFGEIDKNIHVVTPEQTSFFKVTFKVEEIIDEKKFKDKQMHLVYEWVNLKTGKMSSRVGNIIEADWLIDEAKNKILELYKNDEEVAEILAVAAVKYSFLKNSVSSPIAFDFDESISLEGNSGPYLLYTYVRTQSVLKKENSPLITEQWNDGTINEEERFLLRSIYQFPFVVEKSAINFAPNYIATYLFNLAQQFNLFYQKYPILKADEKTKQMRLLITNATGQVLKKGLYLLGIKTVERM